MIGGGDCFIKFEVEVGEKERRTLRKEEKGVKLDAGEERKILLMLC